MRILAIDPGSEQSAYVVYDTETMEIKGMGLVENKGFLCGFRGDGRTFFNEWYDAPVIEFPVPRGQKVYHQLFETIWWIGRFEEARGLMLHVDRKDVKMCLCHKVFKITDANVTAAIRSRYYGISPGGGSKPEIGTKKEPGPLYGVKKDIWAALGVAITYAESIKDVESFMG